MCASTGNTSASAAAYAQEPSFLHCSYPSGENRAGKTLPGSYARGTSSGSARKL